MKTRLVQIGNSRGIRLPKTVLAEAQLEDEVELKAEPGCIVIRSARRPRAGWAEAAQKMRHFPLEKGTNILDESGSAARRNFEIGRILHLRSEIRNLKLDGPI